MSGRIGYQVDVDNRSIPELGGAIVAECPTFEFKIYIAGPIEVAKQMLRKECMFKGLCVTIEPTLYIYTGGEETGYVVGLINYPRFPAKFIELERRALDIAYTLMQETAQKSCTVSGPSRSYFIQNLLAFKESVSEKAVSP